MGGECTDVGALPWPHCSHLLTKRRNVRWSNKRSDPSAHRLKLRQLPVVREPSKGHTAASVAGDRFMHSPARLLIIPVVSLGVLIGTPGACAQMIPKSLIRLCLRNVISGIACYVIGRGGELIVDGTLSAAWAKAMETVTGDEHKDEAKDKQQQPPVGTPPPSPSFKNPLIEPIKPSELGSLSERLVKARKLAPNDKLAEGFFIYGNPYLPKPDYRKPGSLATELLESAPAKTSNPLSAGSTPPQPAPGKSAQPSFLPPALLPAEHPKLSQPKSFAIPNWRDAYRARNAHNLFAPGGLLNPHSRFAGQLSDAQLDCQRRREQLFGLSLSDILGKPDFDVKLQNRVALVVMPCTPHRGF
jgi:hypothetical protein